MRRKNTAPLFLRLDGSKRLFMLMLVTIIVITIDSEIGYVADFIPEQISSRGGVFAFIVIAAIFAITQYFILDYVKQSNKETRERVSKLLTLHTGVSVVQYILAAVIALVILQILLTQQYSTISLYIVHAISYGLWIVILSLLAFAFFFWYVSSNNNLIVLIFVLAMIAYVVNGITSVATYFDMLTQQKRVVTSTDVAYFPEFSIESIGSQIGLASQIASAAAYVLTWIGTVKMLYPYIKKLGKIKFWIIMGVAMIYYLISFPLFVLGYFTPSENVDAMTNVLIFSFAGIMSGIIFGAAFLSVARTLRKDSDLRNHMVIAAYGFVLFYIAGSAMASQAAYPPYGIVSVSFTGLSCYLIYTGLYSSAVTVSQDTTLRLSIRKSVSEQAKFLDSMGTAQMEQELQSTVTKIARKHSDVLTKKTGVESSMTDADIKEYLTMVLNEIHKSDPLV
ncbi:MAG: hypothetical protein WBX81_03640 [Nitrososphaeraceae archaeon]